jgi:hypothetical protein
MLANAIVKRRSWATAAPGGAKAVAAVRRNNLRRAIGTILFLATYDPLEFMKAMP